MKIQILKKLYKMTKHNKINKIKPIYNQKTHSR